MSDIFLKMIYTCLVVGFISLSIEVLRGITNEGKEHKPNFWSYLCVSSIYLFIFSVIGWIWTR